MTKRKGLAPNNRHGHMKAFMSELGSTPVHIRKKKSNDRQSIFGHARAGRQNSEGFGGGSRLGR